LHCQLPLHFAVIGTNQSPPLMAGIYYSFHNAVIYGRQAAIAASRFRGKGRAISDRGRIGSLPFRLNGPFGSCGNFATAAS
jgi:hypothetical protein